MGKQFFCAIVQGPARILVSLRIPVLVFKNSHWSFERQNSSNNAFFFFTFLICFLTDLFLGLLRLRELVFTACRLRPPKERKSGCQLLVIFFPDGDGKIRQLEKCSNGKKRSEQRLNRRKAAVLLSPHSMNCSSNTFSGITYARTQFISRYFFLKAYKRGLFRTSTITPCIYFHVIAVI